MKHAVQQPDEQLASIIVDALIKYKLINSSSTHEAKYKIQSGTARPEDWRLWTTLFDTKAQRDEGTKDF